MSKNLYISDLSVTQFPLTREHSSGKGRTPRYAIKMMKPSSSLPLVILVLVMTGMVEQGKCHACASTFFSTLVQLIPCRAAVAPFSAIPPSDACCKAVKTLGQPCLCILVNGPPISGVDRNIAMRLPDKCTANFEPCELTKK